MAMHLNLSIPQQLFGVGADMGIASGSGLVWIAIIGVLLVLGVVLCCNEIYLKRYRDRPDRADEADRRSWYNV